MPVNKDLNTQTTRAENSRIQKILQILAQEYPQTASALHFRNPFELLLAVMLSAQTTDLQVNKITKKLFQKVKEPCDLLNMGVANLAEEIKECGLYRRKSLHMVETARLLCDKFGGEVPRTREELMMLPGVGRKTANVVLSAGFGIPAFAVDTHVLRVSRRLGLARGKNALAVEEEICRLVPAGLWLDTHRRLIAHGRQVCKARKPSCSSCSLNPCCPGRLDLPASLPAEPPAGEKPATCFALTGKAKTIPLQGSWPRNNMEAIVNDLEHFFETLPRLFANQP